MSETRTTIADRPPVPGSEATVREIAQQPDVWREAAAAIEAQRDQLDAFLGPLLEQANLRIVLTGAGTSAFIGGIASSALSRITGRRVDAVATTDIVSNPRESFAEDLPTLLVSFARSGKSPESTAATRLADECLSEVNHLILTCDRSGDLFLEHDGRADSHVALMPERANDEAFAMTSSFTSMLLSVLVIFGGENPNAVAALVDAGRDIVRTRQDAIQDLAHAGFDRVVFLGSGPLTALARESALKLLELTAGEIVTYYDSALGFRHGPKSVLDEQTLAIVFVSSDPYTRRYDEGIVAELRATLQPDNVVVVASEDLPDDGEPWILNQLAGLDDAFLAVGYVLIAQYLGLAFSLRLGKTPDNPFPHGDVNRVVKGVTIYPLGATATEEEGDRR